MLRGFVKIWSNVHIFLGCLFAILVGKFLINFFTVPTVKELIQLSKCPACFGVNICPEFMKNQISISGFSLYTTIVNKFGPGNIFYGLYNDQRVVLKKLGNSWEINEVEKKICLHLGLGPGCNVENTLWHPEDFYETIGQVLTLPALHSDNHIEFNKFHLCPSTENLELLLHRYYQVNKSINRKILSINIWFMLLLNPEPLLLQTISKDDDNSPVPKYYGACGRVVMEEYVGDTLTYFYNSPWLKRVHITYQLLSAATYFTERHPYFSFYLTDISPDNIAINDAGVVKFIDLENVIVVDRTITNIEKFPDWLTPHITDNIECVGCYHFSAHDICNHNISDHNYYVICQHILNPDTSSDLLPGGLLHDLPTHIHKSYPEIVNLIRSCVQPEPPQNDRFSTVQKLKHALSEILKVSKHSK